MTNESASRIYAMMQAAEHIGRQLWGRLAWREDALASECIDMGDGRTLGAEDVLEGHYRRLYAPHTSKRSAARSSIRSSAQGGRDVQVQVSDNLIAAITVLAPSLAPLAELAEDVARTVPSVRPEPDFRERLHEALERTHRQHAAQRTLGTRVAVRPARPVWQRPAPVAVVVAFLVALTAAWSWFIWRNSQKSSAVAAS